MSMGALLVLLGIASIVFMCGKKEFSIAAVVIVAVYVFLELLS